MKKKMILLLVLCMFLLTSTAFATDWVYMGKSTQNIGSSNVYIDKDTLARNGSNVIFWKLFVLDNAESDGTKKWMYKTEVITASPRQYRLLESYAYTATDQEVYRNLTPSNYYPVDKLDQDLNNRLIDFALQNTK